MKEYIKNITHQQVFIGLISLALVSVIFSKFLLSVSMFGMLFLSFTRIDSIIPFQMSWREDNQQRFSLMLKDKMYWIISLVFWMFLISGIWSENISNWGNAVRLTLPFLQPFIFLSHPKISKKAYLFLHVLFIIACLVAAMSVLFKYLINFAEITESIKKGQAIPTPFSRPNFGVVIAFGFLSSLVITIQSLLNLHKKYMWILGAISVFLLIFLHVLSVRAGILTAYTGIIILGILWLRDSKKYLLGIGLFVGLACIPLVSYLTIPSFKNKLDYTFYDLERFASDRGGNYSDSERLYSIQAGWHVFKEHPILGSGTGDLRKECMKYYRSQDIQMLFFKYPHNQFIYILASVGLLGLLLFLVSIYAPLFFHQNSQNTLLICLYISISVLFLVESPLGRSNMIAFYLILLLMGLRMRGDAITQ